MFDSEGTRGAGIKKGANQRCAAVRGPGGAARGADGRWGAMSGATRRVPAPHCGSARRPRASPAEVRSGLTRCPAPLQQQQAEILREISAQPANCH